MADFEFVDFEPEHKVNPYTEVLQALADLNDPNKGWPLTVDVNEANKESFKVQRAANEIGKTARIRRTITDNVVEEGVDEDGNPVKSGTVTFIFTITKMHRGRRNKKIVVDGVEPTEELAITEENSDENNTESESDSEEVSSGRGRKR